MDKETSSIIGLDEIATFTEEDYARFKAIFGSVPYTSIPGESTHSWLGFDRAAGESLTVKSIMNSDGMIEDFWNRTDECSTGSKEITLSKKL